MRLKLLLSAIAAAAAALLPLGAGAGPLLVADVATGRVLYAHDATEPWYPASVTKLMTTYVVLSALRDGRITPETPLTVSARASSASPSKMGFKPGTEVTVDNALKMMLVKSANDMAVVLAEGVGGSVENFADMMNAAAQQLGMRQSHFVNPNGLPDERNQTSARDLAVLARSILYEFPQYGDLFGIGAIQLGRRVLKNTNGLIGRYPGADGMKTGFICSSGFNVVATATRGNKKLIVVVLGSRSAAERTIKAAMLFDRGFQDSGYGGPGTLDTLPLSANVSPPDLRPQICGGQGNRGEEEAEIASAPSAPGDNPIAALFAGSKPEAAAWQVQGANPRMLGPRAEFVPMPVFIGRTPGAAPTVTARKGKGKGKTTTAYAPDQPSAESAEGPRALEAATKPVGKPVLTKGAKSKAGAGAKAEAKPKAQKGVAQQASATGKKPAKAVKPAPKPASKPSSDEDS